MSTDVPYGWRKTGETYTCERCGKPTSNRKLSLYGKGGYSWCDECGFEMPIWDGDGGWMAFYFCPNCGAAVVDDD